MKYQIRSTNQFIVVFGPSSFPPSFVIRISSFEFRLFPSCFSNLYSYNLRAMRRYFPESDAFRSAAQSADIVPV